MKKDLRALGWERGVGKKEVRLCRVRRPDVRRGGRPTREGDRVRLGRRATRPAPVLPERLPNPDKVEVSVG